METRNIFIDASIFISHNYNFQSAVFENISRLAKDGQANLFVTDITVQEVKAHIEEDISKAVQASAKFKKDARVLRNIDSPPYREFFADIDESVVLEILLRQLDDFIKEAGITILSTSEASVASVFQKYFSKKPPFGDGKKKAEFPDAFAIEALEDWCAENDELMYVASADSDLKNHCDTSDRLIPLAKLAEFISLVEFHDEVLSPSIMSLIEKNKAVLEESIAESFCNKGFWIDDQDGDVNEVRVNDIEVQEILLLEVDQNSAVVQVDVKTEFSADLTYADLDTASYDSEDKVLIPWRTIDKTVEQEAQYMAIVHIAHDIEDPEYFAVESVNIETERNWGFSVSSDDEWP